MNTKSPSNKPATDWRPLKKIFIVFGGLLALHLFFDLPGRFFYETRPWDIPTDAQQKAEYDYAHSLKLPAKVPQPVPFHFWLARLKALVPWQPSVDQQYFNHLCETEAGDYIFKTVENVEGVFQMRPRDDVYGKPIDHNRYKLEEPTGIGSGDNGSAFKMSKSDSFRTWGAGTGFVQPHVGVYSYLEQPNRDEGSGIYRFKREINPTPPNGYQNGVQSGYKGHIFSPPFTVSLETDTQRRARYGFTWRGIKRELDRRYSIGAGEHLIVDMDTHEVLAVKRAFKLSGKDENTSSRIWWGNARWCKGKEWEYRYLVRDVLRPVPGLNEKFLREHLPENLKFLLTETK